MAAPKLRFKDVAGCEFPKLETRKLKNICHFFSGGTPSSKNKSFYNGNIPFIRSAEIYGNHTELFLTEAGLKASSAKMVNVGDILYALYGANSGEVAISKIKGAINQAILCIRPDNMNKEYLCNYLYFKKRKIVATLLQGGQGNLSGELVKSIHVPVPSLPEQQKIANFLTTVDRQIDIQSQRVEAMKNRKKGFLQKIFSQELRFKDDEEREYPEWKEKSIESLGTFFNGLSGKTKLDFENGNEYFIPYMNVYKNAFAKTDQLQTVKIKEEEKQNRVNYGDIMFTQSSETVEEVGLSSVWLGESHPFLNSFCFGFRLTDVKNSVPAFWGVSLRSTAVRKQIMLGGQGISRINLSPNRLKKIIVFCPSLPEQQKIADFLTAVDHQIEVEENRLERMQVIKKGLLQQMFI